MLDLAKMDSNNFQFNDEYFDLIASLKKTIDQQEFLSKKKEIEISYSFRNKVGKKPQELDESYLSISESIDISDDKL